jgi:hypothetical protein
MDSIAPQDIWRSEAFAEDLFDDRSEVRDRGTPPRRLAGVMLCALPLAVAVVGGLLAYFNAVA